VPCELFTCVFRDECDHLHCPAVEENAEDCGYYSCEFCVFYDSCTRPERDEEEGSEEE